MIKLARLFCFCLSAVALFVPSLFAGETVYTGPLANEAGIAYSTDYVLDMSGKGIDNLTFQAVYSTPTFSTATVYDGVKATGVITVVDASLLSGKSFSIGNYRLIEGRNWTVADTSTGTAKAISAAINGYNPLKNYVTAAWVEGETKVSITAKSVGTASNFAIASTLPAALSVLGMSGARDTDIDYTANTISESGHGLTTAIGVCFEVAVGSAPTPLAGGTTYYVIPATLNTFKLATSVANAKAGTAIDLQAVPDEDGSRFTFAPINNGGTGYVVWSVSNDGTNYNLLDISSATITGAGSSMWDFSTINYRYIKASFTAAASSVYRLILTGNGKKD